MEEIWDLIVVGAGPAGAAAALEARRLAPGARVLLLDRAAFPRDKPCGDGIGPHAVAELAALGAGAALDGYPPIRRLRLRAPGGIEVSGVPARPSWVVPRRVLDERLVRAAVRAGAVLERERVRSLEQRDGLVVVNGALAARVAVGADGANSAVRRLLGAPASPDRQTAIALRGYAPPRPAHRSSSSAGSRPAGRHTPGHSRPGPGSPTSATGCCAATWKAAGPSWSDDCGPCCLAPTPSPAASARTTCPSPPTGRCLAATACCCAAMRPR